MKTSEDIGRASNFSQKTDVERGNNGRLKKDYKTSQFLKASPVVFCKKGYEPSMNRKK